MGALLAFVFWSFGGFDWLAGREVLQTGILPSCDGKTSIDLVKKAIEGSPLSKLAVISVFDIKSAREVPPDNSNEFDPSKRSCTADVLMNSGRQTIRYTIEWSSPAKDKIWVQVSLL